MLPLHFFTRGLQLSYLFEDWKSSQIIHHFQRRCPGPLEVTAFTLDSCHPVVALLDPIMTLPSPGSLSPIKVVTESQQRVKNKQRQSVQTNFKMC